MVLKITLIGNTGAGKTRSVNELLGVAQPGRFIPTLCCEVHSYSTADNKFNIWDIAGDPKHMGENGLKSIEPFCKDTNMFIYYMRDEPRPTDISDTEWFNFMKEASPGAKIIIYRLDLGHHLATLWPENDPYWTKAN
jgi:hypothetical protein